jgi:hypothetical protein
LYKILNLTSDGFSVVVGIVVVATVVEIGCVVALVAAGVVVMLWLMSLLLTLWLKSLLKDFEVVAVVADVPVVLVLCLSHQGVSVVVVPLDVDGSGRYRRSSLVVVFAVVVVVEVVEVVEVDVVEVEVDGVGVVDEDFVVGSSSLGRVLKYHGRSLFPTVVDPLVLVLVLLVLLVLWLVLCVLPLVVGRVIRSHHGSQVDSVVVDSAGIVFCHQIGVG